MHGKCAAVALRERPTAGFPSLNPVVYLIGLSLVSGRSLCMYLRGIGVFIKLTHGERATQGDGVCGTQILFHTHRVCFDVESTYPYSHPP